MTWEQHTRMSGYLQTLHLSNANPATRSWPTALALAAVIAAAVVIFDAPQPFRSLVILVFLGLVPGLSLIDLLGIVDLTQRLALGIGVSLALATIVAGFSLYAGLWSPLGILLVLVAITLVGAALQLRVLATSPDNPSPDLAVRGTYMNRSGHEMTPPGATIAAPDVDINAAKATTSVTSKAPELPAMANPKDDSSTPNESFRPFPSVRLTKTLVLLGFISGCIMLIARSTRRALRR